VTFGPTEAICVQELKDRGARSIWNPVSLEDRSFQDRSIRLADAGDAERPSGAMGRLGCVVAVARLEKAAPAVLNAPTR
jgi:hypothetical protein